MALKVLWQARRLGSYRTTSGLVARLPQEISEARMRAEWVEIGIHSQMNEIKQARPNRHFQLPKRRIVPSQKHEPGRTIMGLNDMGLGARQK